MVPRLLEPVPSGSDAMMTGGRGNLLSWIYIRRGNYDRARQIQLENPTRIVRGTPLLGTPGGTLVGRCLVGLSYAMQGRMTEAERIYRAVLHEAQHGGPSCVEPAYIATAMLGEVLYEQNQPQAVLDLLEDKVDVLERVSIPDSVLRLQYMLSAAHWALGHRLESFACLDRLEDDATQLRLDRLVVYSLTAQAHRRLQLGERQETEELMQRLEEIERRQPRKRADQVDEIGTMAGRGRARWMMVHGDLDGTARILDSLISSMEARDQQRLYPQLLLMCAVIERGRGREAQSREAVLTALRLGHRLGLVRTLLDADPAAPALIREIAADPALDPVLAFYVERLCPANAASPSPAAAGGTAVASTPQVLREALSEREADVVRLMAQAMPNKKIARALGLSPETVKWHLKNIYGKLGVSGRDEAVERVRDMQLGSDTGQGH